MRKTHRRLFFLVSGVGTVMGIVAACSFPDPRLVDENGNEGGVDGGGDGTVEGGEDVVTVADATSEGIDLDAPPPIDATSEKPPVDANCNPCDCDDDGYKTKDATVCDATGNDCDDLDKRAFPDAGFVADLPTQDTKGDWNCDGKFTLEWAPGTDCSKSSSVIFGGCTSVQGFQAPEVTCGVESSTWVQCKDPAIAGACLNGTSEKRVQRCK